jgi:hypothetical protein
MARFRSLGLNFSGPAQRTFILLEFVLLMFTMVYLLYLIVATMDHVAASVTGVDKTTLALVLERVNMLLLVRISLLFFVVFIVHVVLGLFLLHRVTGPLVRFKRILNQIADGKIPNHPVTLRKGDFPTDVSDALTDALKQIRRWKASSNDPD